MESKKWSKVKHQVCLNKADIQKEVLEMIDFFSKKSIYDGTKTSVYYHTLIGLLNKFHIELDKLTLMENLEDFWGYALDITYLGVQLNLCHYECSETANNEFDEPMIFCDEIYTLHRVNSRLLTVEEYASRFGVDGVTVRQWIRRGKLRTAIKQGNEWRIPELTDLPFRGWRNATYYWDKELIVDSEHEYFNEYDALHIFQDESDRSKYEVRMFKRNISHQSKRFILDIKEKEKFELFCISHPDIRYLEMVTENYEADWRLKNE